MSNGDLNWIANYIWGIADDVLRDLYVRGKYRDVILPMTVLRRLDAVLDMKAALDAAGVIEQDAALRQAAGQGFYNTPTSLRSNRRPQRCSPKSSAGETHHNVSGAAGFAPVLLVTPPVDA